MRWPQPWTWPVAHQRASLAGAVIAGIVLASPVWLISCQEWREASEAQAQLSEQRQATLEILEVTRHLMQTQTEPKNAFVDLNELTARADQQGLQLTQVGWDLPVQTPALKVLALQQQPMHLQAHGSWDAWLGWLAHWPTAAPGVTLSSLELKADPRGGIAAQLVAVAPQSSEHDADFELASVEAAGPSPTDPFNAQVWSHLQRTHAQQHPSYARLVEPELRRPKDPLETFPRERLHYVGQISAGAELEALIKVLPVVGANKEVAMLTVHRVRVGGHLGQDFGRVLAISTEQLLVQELVLAPTGEWQSRQINLPLKETSP